MKPFNQNPQSADLKIKRVILLQDTRIRQAEQINLNTQPSAFKQNFKQNVSNLNIPQPQTQLKNKNQYCHETQTKTQSNYIDNIIIGSFLKLNEQICSLNRRVDELEQKIQEIQNKNEDRDKKSKPKKLRRKFQEITKNHICLVQNCKKAYGSEVSLKLHIKLKHNEYVWEGEKCMRQFEEDISDRVVEKKIVFEEWSSGKK